MSAIISSLLGMFRGEWVAGLGFFIGAIAFLLIYHGIRHAIGARRKDK